MTSRPSRLSGAPDFAAIEKSARKSEPQRKIVLGNIGNLLVNWGNNEGMLVRLLMVLLETKFESAQIVFHTMNTTQTRLDLIKRLALSRLNGEMQEKTLKLLDRFKALTRTRNQVAHSMWEFNQEGYIVGMWTVRFTEKFDGKNQEEYRQVDQARMNEIHNITKLLVRFNRDIWAFLPDLEKHIEDSREEQA